MDADLGEVHVEQLLGCRVRDSDGVVLGRLEDFRVEIVDGEAVVTEFHIGGAAVLERIAGFLSELPLIRYLPFRLTEYRVRWQDIDLSDGRRPRVVARKADLRRVPQDAETPPGAQ
jgi:sporulation protein YlmC with PRC-barrel domain